MDIINCTDEDLNGEINSGKPIFPPRPFAIGKESCWFFPLEQLSRSGGHLQLYNSYGSKHVNMRDLRQGSPILAFLDAGRQLQVKVLPRANAEPSKAGALLVNCTEESYRIAKDRRSNAEDVDVPSWQCIALPERHTRNDWLLRRLEDETIQVADLGESWNDVLILTPGIQGEEVNIVSLVREQGTNDEVNTLFHAVR